MKHIITFFSLIAAIICTFTSCGKNDTSSSVDSGSLALVGKWQLTSMTMNGEPVPFSDVFYEFKADGSLIIEQSTGKFTCTYKFDQKENTLTVSAYAGSAEMVYQIVKLTQSEFSFMFSQTTNGVTKSFVHNFKKI